QKTVFNFALENGRSRSCKSCAVHPPWEKFEAFLSYIEATIGRPEKGMTIERIDVNSGYAPGNICWATNKQQQRNKRSNHVLIVRGFTGCLSEICEHFGCPYDRTKRRLQLGWDAQSAVLTLLTNKWNS